MNVETLQNITSYLEKIKDFNRRYFAVNKPRTFKNKDFGPGAFSEVTDLFVIGFLLTELSAIKTIPALTKKEIATAVGEFNSIFSLSTEPLRYAIIEAIKKMPEFSSKNKEDRSFLNKINIINQK
jgi:hypothetical protein